MSASAPWSRDGRAAVFFVSGVVSANLPSCGPGLFALVPPTSRPTLREAPSPRHSRHSDRETAAPLWKGNVGLGSTPTDPPPQIAIGESLGRGAADVMPVRRLWTASQRRPCRRLQR